MCVGSPKVPKASADAAMQIPVRQPVLLPDNGDPSVVAGLKNARRLTSSAMILTGQGGSLGSPTVAAPLGSSGL